MARVMKDSGIEWIGQIPENWGTPKIVNQFGIVGSGTTPKSNEDGYYEDGTIYWIQSGDLHNIFLESTNKKITQEAFDNASALKIYEPDYLVIAMYGASIGNISISKIRACTNQACCVLADSKNILKYMYYVISSAKDYLIYSAMGGTQPNIGQNIIRNLRFPLPMLTEQIKIADFLDKKVFKINTIISKTKKSIDEYRKYKQAVITEAVTKGLDYTVQMKDSGIEWIGLVPKHWKYGRIKYNTYIKGRIGWQGLKAEEFIDEGPYLVTGMHFGNNCVLWDECYHISKERFEEAPEIHLQQDDLIMTKDGTIGKVAYIDELPDKATLNSHLLLIRPKTELFINKYMMWLLKSNVFVSYYTYYSYGSIMASISQEQFKNFNFFCPDIKEQQEIVEYLNTKCTEIDALIAKKEAFVEEMEAYKKSLIYEYVTGKKEV